MGGAERDRDTVFGRFTQTPPTEPTRNRLPIMTTIRFTVTDASGTVSFNGPGHAMKMLVASCARGAANLRELLELARPYDDAFVTRVIHGLYVFDEHNVSDDAAHVHGLLTALPATTWPPFRIVDDVTRAASTQPAGAGLIVLNLKARRIVQIHNSYAEILRRDRGRNRIEGQPTPTQYWYELPHEWAILP